MENKSRSVSDSSGESGVGRVLPRSPSQKALNVLHFLFGFIAWSVRWTAALVFFIAVMVGVAWYVFNQASMSGTPVVVPDVTGLAVTDAANLLADTGLEMGTQRRMTNDAVPQYHVIVQRPRAGEVVRAGRKVNLIVSEGVQTKPAPGFLGKVLKDAQTEIESTQFIMGSVARIPDARPVDTILAQDPPPLVPIQRGTEIHFLVSGGPKSEVVRMPAIVGKKLDEAQLALANLNVTVVPIKTDRPDAEPDIVLSQNPEAGTELTDGQEVSFEIKLAENSYLPTAQRRVSGQFQVPDLGRDVAVRVEMVDESGTPKLYYPGPNDAPVLPSRTIIKFNDIKYGNELTIRFYVDGALHTSYYYQGDATQPLVTTNSGTAAAPAPGTPDSRVRMEELEPTPDARFPNQ